MPKETNRIGWVIFALLILGVVGFGLVQLGGFRSSRLFVGWLGVAAHQKLFPEQDAARSTYEDIAKGPLPVATLVRQFHAAWPGESAGTVNHAVGEVVTGLLHYDDIEVGEFVGGKFVPWPMKPWEAEDKILAELAARIGSPANEPRAVFRWKPDRIPPSTP